MNVVWLRIVHIWLLQKKSSLIKEKMEELGDGRKQSHKSKSQWFWCQTPWLTLSADFRGGNKMQKILVYVTHVVYVFLLSALSFSALRDNRIQLVKSTATELIITIADVQLSDDGEYTCSIFTMPVRTARATVTVLGMYVCVCVHFHSGWYESVEFNIDIHIYSTFLIPLLVFHWSLRLSWVSLVWKKYLFV